MAQNEVLVVMMHDMRGFDFERQSSRVNWYFAWKDNV